MAFEQRVTRPRSAAMAIALSLGLAGCSSAAPSPIIIYKTPEPTITPVVIYVTPAPTPTAAATDTPVPSDTPAPSASPTSAASPTSRAAACTGNAKNKAFFAEAADNEPFDVYCAVLPSSWWLEVGEYTLPNGGTLGAYYKNAAGHFLEIIEGNWCAANPGSCSSAIGVIGPASFDSLGGTLGIIGPGPVYIIYLDLATDHAYVFIGKGMSQAQFVAWAAAIRKVPRS